ncbi:hypothetical protein HYFRA_00013215 [Hymenoscyphus fraxineus]|uniref:Uncharacterized protein n=1 Tax=Hymenoscyphus fraxineus TaxID=746836 RepID=A0A9N9LAN8_9HELO|nr:hypothetical protein HYFRA_00013215 [Hymenoscyphus fraxineus]
MPSPSRTALIWL